MKVNLSKNASQKLNIVMDSTGLKIYDEGEWKVRQHGVSKKAHLAQIAYTSELIQKVAKSKLRF